MAEPKYKNYRVCYEGGNSKTGAKIYELFKYCKCDGCTRRLKMYRQPANRITASTKDINKVDEIAECLKNWTCKDGSKMLDIVYKKF